MKVLITGCAGFIGSNLTDKLLDENIGVVGVDNFNHYYDPNIKKNNIKNALTFNNFTLYKNDILDYYSLKKIFSIEKPNKIIHLAARTGVRPSIKNPFLYAQTNVLGTVNLLNLSKEANVDQFIFGSSSSVYGNSNSLPFTEEDPCEDIISPYGASKRASEFWVESFSKTYGLKSVILRFFTVFGPRSRPDMAPALFTNAIMKDDIIIQYGDGLATRDYTYIDDIVDGLIKSLGSNFDFEIINLGNNHPISLNEFIKTLERIISKKSKIKKVSKQAGDVYKTWANIEKARRILDWKPKVDIVKGLKSYVRWLENT